MGDSIDKAIEKITRVVRREGALKKTDELLFSLAMRDGGIGDVKKIEKKETVLE